MERIILKEGANITLTGSSELRLRESLAILATTSIEDNHLLINAKDTPKLNVYGHRVEITSDEGSEELKVRKKFSSVLEVSSSKDSPVKEGRLPFDLSWNDSRIATIKVHYSHCPLVFLFYYFIVFSFLFSLCN